MTDRAALREKVGLSIEQAWREGSDCCGHIPQSLARAALAGAPK